MTASRLVVETEDLSAAARSMHDGVAEPLFSGVFAALGDAAAQVGMAGDDPPGRSWAVAYARAARSAALGAQDVVNGCYQLAALFAATAQNYARADHASTVADRRTIGAVTAGLPVPTFVQFSEDFTAAGGGGSSAPFGWGLVQGAVGYVWPNGHQDRLRAAATAWRRSADALAGHAYKASFSDVDVLVDRLPEAADMSTACSAMCAHLLDVAQAHRTLGRACEELAHHIDVAHSKIEHELTVFLAESAAIQAAGAVVGAVTLGLGEGAAQGGQAAKLAATLARIGALLKDFAEAVGEVLASIPGAAEASARVSSAVRELLSVRIVSVEVAGVPGLRVLQVARDGRNLATGAADAGGEIAAETRLAATATEPPELRLATTSPRTGEWNDPGTLEDHFTRHARKFGISSESDYIARAGQFLRRAREEHFEVKIDEATGDIRVFDRATRTFGSYTRDGTIRTFFRGTSKSFWSNQKGTPVQW